jgi:synaptobrevin family protein YKT6
MTTKLPLTTNPAFPNSSPSSARPSPNERNLDNDKMLKNNVHSLHRFKTRALTNRPAYTFHAYGRSEGIAGLIISDHEYPALVAHQLLSKIVDEFLSKYPRSSFMNISGPGQLQLPQLKEYITKYQDPSQADSIMRIQKELDETKITLHKTIESVLERGEKLDQLVAKSDGLSAQSKLFYTQAKKQNSCCLVM